MYTSNPISMLIYLFLFQLIHAWAKAVRDRTSIRNHSSLLATLCCICSYKTTQSFFLRERLKLILKPPNIYMNSHVKVKKLKSTKFILRLVIS